MSHWQTYPTRWSLLKPPLRPDPSVVERVRSLVGGGAAPVLLLGVTPELAAAFPVLEAVDRSPEMIAALRPIFPDVAVLFVTGFAGESATSEFGDHQVLRKPFTLAGLERAVIAAMAPGRPSPPRQIAAE